MNPFRDFTVLRSAECDPGLARLREPKGLPPHTCTCFEQWKHMVKGSGDRRGPSEPPTDSTRSHECHLTPWVCCAHERMKGDSLNSAAAKVHREPNHNI